MYQIARHRRYEQRNCFGVNCEFIYLIKNTKESFRNGWWKNVDIHNHNFYCCWSWMALICHRDDDDDRNETKTSKWNKQTMMTIDAHEKSLKGHKFTVCKRFILLIFSFIDKLTLFSFNFSFSPFFLYQNQVQPHQWMRNNRKRAREMNFVFIFIGVE